MGGKCDIVVQAPMPQVQSQRRRAYSRKALVGDLKMQDRQPKPSRRGFFFGAAATGAAAATIAALPRAPIVEAALQEPMPAPEKGGGYSLSDHVKRYYKTARV
jgi:hypothetical protein